MTSKVLPTAAISAAIAAGNLLVRGGGGKKNLFLSLLILIHQRNNYDNKYKGKVIVDCPITISLNIQHINIKYNNK